MFLDWGSLQSNVEILAECRDVLVDLNDRRLVEFLLAILVCEYGIDMKQLVHTTIEISDLNGDPLDYIDEDSGEINFLA